MDDMIGIGIVIAVTVTVTVCKAEPVAEAMGETVDSSMAQMQDGWGMTVKMIRRVNRTSKTAGD